MSGSQDAGGRKELSRGLCAIKPAVRMYTQPSLLPPPQLVGALSSCASCLSASTHQQLPALPPAAPSAQGQGHPIFTHYGRWPYLQLSREGASVPRPSEVDSLGALGFFPSSCHQTSLCGSSRIGLLPMSYHLCLWLWPMGGTMGEASLPGLSQSPVKSNSRGEG